MDVFADSSSGSSLLTRGKPVPEPDPPARQRLIPAYAGKTARRSARIGCRPAHPCLRGENHGQVKTKEVDLGSSLLTRGKRDPPVGDRLDTRLIPAYAGKTQVVPHSWHTSPAHPCLRGENSQRRCPTKSSQRGSSLLTRGKRRRTRGLLRTERLIPAYAGKTTP